MRRVAAAIGSNAGSTRTAVACVVRASGVYLGLATKVSWPGPATSRPAAEVISASGSPWRVAPRCAARVESFMGRIVEELSVVSSQLFVENHWYVARVPLSG